MGAISLNDVIQINADMIRTFGGSHNGSDNLCNANSLLWCLDAVQNGYYTTDSERAAIIIDVIATRHVFYDGNKRTAVFAALFYLENCGYDVHIPDYDSMRDLVIALITHTATKEDVINYINMYIL